MDRNSLVTSATFIECRKSCFPSSRSNVPDGQYDLVSPTKMSVVRPLGLNHQLKTVIESPGNTSDCNGLYQFKPCTLCSKQKIALRMVSILLADTCVLSNFQHLEHSSLLNSHKSPSAMNVYVAAITTHHGTMDGNSGIPYAYYYLFKGARCFHSQQSSQSPVCGIPLKLEYLMLCL